MPRSEKLLHICWLAVLLAIIIMSTSIVVAP
jgi:hypothetical protein